LLYAPVSLIMQSLGFLHVTARGSARITLISSPCSSLLRTISTQDLQQKNRKVSITWTRQGFGFFFVFLQNIWQSQ